KVCDGLKKLVWNLSEDSGTIASLGLSTHGTSVFEVLESRQGEIDDVTASASPHGGNKRDTTGVVLIGGVIQPVHGLQRASRWHRTSFCFDARQNRDGCRGVVDPGFPRSFSVPRNPLPPEMLYLSVFGFAVR